MVILGISSATPYTEIALVKGEKTLFHKGWQSDFNEAEKLFPALKRALKKNGKIDKVFVVRGPGGFTGLRVGIVIANTVAYANKVKLFGMDTFDFLLEKIPAKYRKKTAIALRAGGNNIRMLLPSGKKLSATTDELLKILEKHKVGYLTGDLNPETKKQASSAKWLELKDLLPLDEIIKKTASKKNTEHSQIKPFYLKPPQITPPKNALYSGNTNR